LTRNHLHLTYTCLLKTLILFLLLPLFGAAQVHIGPAAVPLNGPWKFNPGDDPRWADPAFDDSAWEAVDLTPLPGAHDSDVGLPRYVPGWAARGHKGYAGYAWYHQRVRVTCPSGTTLALTGPPLVDDVYLLYVNGALAGGDGGFSGMTPLIYGIQPRFFQVALRDSILFLSGSSSWR
jgi:hypothetical protein